MEEENRNERYHLALFDGSNFTAWKYRMRVLLEEYELLECIQVEVEDMPELREQDGDTVEVLGQKKKMLEKRLKQERRCKSILISRIHDSQLEYVQDKRTPKAVWDSLTAIFERHSIANRMHLKRQMLSMKFESGSLQEHFLRFDKLVRDYRGTGGEMVDLDVICHLLLTMGSSFSTVVTALETMPEENLTIEFVKCRLLDEEIKQRGAGVDSFPPQSVQAAFSGANARQVKKYKCFRCKSEGHKIADCPVQKKMGNSKSDEKRGKANVAENTSVSFMGKSGGASEEDESVQWYIDSGCSDHLVNDPSLFDDMRPLKHPVEIVIAKNGESIVARHSGTVKGLSRVDGRLIECTVENVLFVPELRCNLFSVLRVDKAGMRVVYESGKVKIYRGSEVVACGFRCGKWMISNFGTVDLAT